MKYLSFITAVSCGLLMTACASSQAETKHEKPATCESGCCLAPAGKDADKSTAASTQAPRDEAWTLAFEDNFDRDTLGDNWKALDGEWTIVDGQLRGNGVIITTKGYPGETATPGEFYSGFHRIEFDIISDVKPLTFLAFPGQEPPMPNATDMGPFIHATLPGEGKPAASAMMSGYLFQFGGQDNTVNRLRKGGKIIWEDENPDTLIEVNKPYHLVFENDHGTVRFYVNGKKLYEGKEEFTIMGPGFDHAGLYLFTAAKVDNLKLYVKTQPNEFDRE